MPGVDVAAMEQYDLGDVRFHWIPPWVLYCALAVPSLAMFVFSPLVGILTLLAVFPVWVWATVRRTKLALATADGNAPSGVRRFVAGSGAGLVALLAGLITADGAIATVILSIGRDSLVLAQMPGNVYVGVGIGLLATFAVVHRVGRNVQRVQVLANVPEPQSLRWEILLPLSVFQLAGVPVWILYAQRCLNLALEHGGEHRESTSLLARIARPSGGLEASYEDEDIRPRVTIGLMLACIAVYVAELNWVGPEPLGADLVKVGAVNLALLQDGEWWRIVTANFIHLSPSHIAGNLLGIGVVGAMLERAIGSLRLLLCLVVAIPSVTFASAMWQGDAVAGGASGLAFCIFGAAVARDWRLQDRIGRVGAFSLASGLAISLAPQVGVAAHLGGMVAGLAAGTVLAWGLPAWGRPFMEVQQAPRQLVAQPPPVRDAPAAVEDPAAIVARLRERAAVGQITDEEAWQFAGAVAHCFGATQAIPWFAYVLGRMPAFAPAHLSLGSAMLSSGDERGLVHLQYVAHHDQELAFAATSIIRSYDQWRHQQAAAQAQSVPMSA